MEPDRIERLGDPGVFPDSAEEVEVVQTHLSVVCLAGGSAYKFKKPVRLPFADFSTLESRKEFCGQELALNRRLCPEIYLAVVPLRRRRDGSLTCLDREGGEIVDYAVRMRRLPADRMLDRLLAVDAVREADVRAIARRVVAFHRGADRGEPVLRWGDPDRLAGFARANFDEIRPEAGRLFPVPLLAALESRTRRDFDRWLPVLRRRASEGRVVDGHGDLHARNICLTDPPAIYDCIEFAPAFRCGDVATEHAFLVMDLRFRGHPELAAAYLDEVIRESRDPEIRDLMPPLVRYRAVVRAKVSAVAAGEPEIPAADRAAAADTARRYLRLAAASAVEEDGPWWLMLCGLPGCGKSSIADGLAASAGGAWPVFSSDRVRKALAGAKPTEALPAACYTPDYSRRTYAELLRLAGASSPSSPVVLLDANFRRKEERLRAREAAVAAGARLAILWVDTDEDTIARRLHRRSGDPESVSDADHAVYRQLREQFEPPALDEGDRLIRVPGAAPAEAAADEALAQWLMSPAAKTAAP